MKRIILFLIALTICTVSWASAPSRQYNYVAGQVIDPVAVTGNEVPLYTYLQSGVDTYKAGSITAASISATAGIVYSQLNLGGGILPTDINTSVTASIYQFENLTVPLATTLSGNTIIGGTIKIGGTTGTLGQTIVSQGGSNPIWGYPSGMLGAPVTKSIGTPGSPNVYQAATDGIVMAAIYFNSGTAQIQCMEDAVNAATVVEVGSGINSGAGANCTMAVPKGYYYQVQDVEVGHTTYYMNFVPSGS